MTSSFVSIIIFVFILMTWLGSICGGCAAFLLFDLWKSRFVSQAGLYSLSYCIYPQNRAIAGMRYHVQFQIRLCILHVVLWTILSSFLYVWYRSSKPRPLFAKQVFCYYVTSSASVLPLLLVKLQQQQQDYIITGWFWSLYTWCLKDNTSSLFRKD